VSLTRGTDGREITDVLWRSYAEERDPDIRSQLLDQYLGLVHHVAREIAGRIPKSLQLDDLISSGTVGLVQALESFDPSRGLAFSTFAVPRIRGAIMDELRSWDWVPRSVRERGRAVKRAQEDLRKSLGREPEPHETAQALGVDLPTYWRYADCVKDPVFMSLDPAPGDDPERAGLSEIIPDASATSQGDALEWKETMGDLARAFGSLSHRDRMVLTLSYYERLTLQQIGQILHITESRVSQLRARALKRIQERMESVEEAA
jgi:RNA polymerase sigma factor for flagellar operon FliA